MTKAIKTKLLLIDQKKIIGKILRAYLKDQDFEIIEADNGAMGVRMFLSLRPELLITDLALPDIEDLELIKSIRQLSNVPVMVYGNSDSENKIVSAINNGADDYFIHPFNPEILLAKINALLRRAASACQNAVNEFLENGLVKINLLKHEITIDGKEVFFSPKQYNLLKYLMMNKGKVLTHREILEEVWGKGYLQESQYLRVHIGNIREKIKQIISDIKLIHTEPGIGYRMEIL